MRLFSPGEIASWTETQVRWPSVARRLRHACGWRLTPILTSRTATFSTPSLRTADAVFTPVRGGRTGRRRQAFISRVKCEGILVGSVARWPLRGRYFFVGSVSRCPLRGKRKEGCIIHGPAHRGANDAAMSTDEDNQDGPFFFNHPERGGGTPLPRRAQPRLLLFRS